MRKKCTQSYNRLKRLKRVSDMFVRKISLRIGNWRTSSVFRMFIDNINYKLHAIA